MPSASSMWAFFSWGGDDEKSCADDAYYKEEEEKKKKDEEEREVSKPSSLSASRTCKDTPASTPPPRSRGASSPAKNSPSRPDPRSSTPRRSLRSSTPATNATPCPNTASSPGIADTGSPRRSLRSSTAATNASPRPNATPKGTPKRSKASSTPSRSLTGRGSGDIERLTSQLKGLTVGDEDGDHLDSTDKEEDKPDTMPPLSRWAGMPQRVNTTTNYGTRDLKEKELMKYVPENIEGYVAGLLRKELQTPPNDSDGKGYVYILQATPRSPAENPSESEGDMIIIKVGSANDPEERLAGIRSKCKHNIYEILEIEGPVLMKYKTEKLMHTQLTEWKYRPENKCSCDTEHRELFKVISKEELEDVHDSIRHWVEVVNKHHDILWPGALERIRAVAKKKAARKSITAQQEVY